MKIHLKILLFLVTLILMFSTYHLLYSQCTSNLALYVGYNCYDGSVPISSQSVDLDYSGFPAGNCISSTTGYCYYSNLNCNTSFTIIPDQASKPWGGGNAVDALLCAKYFVQLPTGLIWDTKRIEIADVNASNNINATDALIILTRFVGIKLAAWVVDDWYIDDINSVCPPQGYSGPTQSTVGGPYYLSEICYGDVKYDYIPPIPKLKPTIDLRYSGNLHVKAGGSFQVAIVTADSLILGSMSLGISVPADKYILHGITLPYTGDSCKAVNSRDQEDIKIAWYNLNGEVKHENDTIVLLTLEALDSQYINSITGITIDKNSVISDTVPQEYSDLHFLQPKIIIDYNKTVLPIMEVSPNPAKGELTINYQTPWDGQVILTIIDSYGNILDRIFDSWQSADIYQLNYNVSNLPGGYYTLRLSCKGYQVSKKIIISR